MRIASLRVLHRPSKRAQGMTLIEMMVSACVGILALLGITIIFMTSTRSFAAMGNYLIMDRTSRNALDVMSRNVRNAKNLTSFGTSQLVFNYAGATNLVYNWDSSSRQLTEWKTGGTPNILITDCDYLQFTMYKNIPLAGGTNATTTTVSAGKAISVSWKCSKSILGKKLSTEDLQEAVIVIRNKPVS